MKKNVLISGILIAIVALIFTLFYFIAPSFLTAYRYPISLASTVSDKKLTFTNKKLLLQYLTDISFWNTQVNVKKRESDQPAPSLTTIKKLKITLTPEEGRIIKHINPANKSTLTSIDVEIDGDGVVNLFIYANLQELSGRDLDYAVSAALFEGIYVIKNNGIATFAYSQPFNDLIKKYRSDKPILSVQDKKVLFSWNLVRTVYAGCSGSIGCGNLNVWYACGSSGGSSCNPSAIPTGCAPGVSCDRYEQCIAGWGGSCSSWSDRNQCENGPCGWGNCVESGSCSWTDPLFCGDGSCNNGETCSTCPGDCGACSGSCGDGSCNNGETCSTCPGDCGACPPGVCDYHCSGALCIAGGTSPPDTCITDCAVCGGGGSCGDGSCNNGETSCSCPSDCGGICCTNNNSPEGYHDAYSGVQAEAFCSAAGWTNDNDKDKDTTDLNVRISVDGTSVSTITASGFRSDLDADCSECGGAGWCCANVCPGGTCSFDTSLYTLMSQGVNHTIAVQAQDIDSCGNLGGWVSLTNTPRTLNCTCTPPASPTGLTPSGNTACGLTTVNLTWNPVTNATSYAVRLDDLSNPWSGNCSALDPGDYCDDAVSGTSRSFPVTPGRNYSFWVHALNTCSWGAPSGASFTVPLCPSCTVDLPNGGISLNTGSNYTVNPNPSVVGGTINNVLYTVGDTSVATVCNWPTSPTCSTGSGTWTDIDPPEGPTFNAQLSGVSIGSTTLTAFATMNEGPTCSDSTSLNGTAGPWWQIIGGDVTAGGISMASTIPSTCTPPCQNVFILDNPTGSPGVPSVASPLLFPSFGSGTPSSKLWQTRNTPVILSDNYSYAFFENKIPTAVTPTVVGSSSVDGGFFESGGFEYPVGSGYYWY